MLYLLAAAGLAIAALLLWRAGSPQELARARAGRPSAPDDDPEFLATLDDRKPGDEGN